MRDIVYGYKALATSREEIRVLDVASAEDANAAISCSIRHVSLLGGSPEYETISYVWGNASDRASLELDGLAITVPSSSIAALRRMRLRDRIRTLWIDAICINQDDLEERAQQVTVMGDIYRSSQGNLIHLGESKPHTEKALEDIKAILNEMHSELDSPQALKDTMFDPWSKQQIFSTRALKHPVDGGLLSENVLLLPWFSRLWVFQEATLAPSNICFLGPFEFDLLDILRSVRWLVHKVRYAPKCIGRQALDSTLHLSDFVDKTYGSHGSGAAKEPSFVQLMDSARSRLVTEPRDRIFAMLGMKKWPDGTPDVLVPDYKKPIADVLREATRYALQERRDDLSLVWSHLSVPSEADLEREDFLSWVPMWNTQHSDLADPAILSPWFAAAAGLGQPCHSETQVNSNLLHLYGLEICTLTDVSTVLTSEASWDSRSVSSWMESATSTLGRDQSPLETTGLNPLDMAR